MPDLPIPGEILAFIGACISAERVRWTYHVAMRHRSEFEKIRAYIENNPVKAGMVRWSGAGVEKVSTRHA
jgi:hypothetical protein